MIQHLGILLGITLMIFSCSRPEPQPAKKVEPVQPVTSPTPPAEIPFLAQIETLKNRADIRVRDEVVWKPAEGNSKFNRFDALQTHEAAEARVRYESGSRLDLKEKTLVIFDKDPGYTEKSADRALLKAGRIAGVAKKELWVFTNAGLVKLKPRKDKQVQAVLDVSDDNRLKVSVQSGSADLITKNKSGNYQKIAILENTNYTVKPASDLGVAVGDKPNAENILLLSEAVPAELNPAQQPAPTPIQKQAELLIESPADNATTDRTTFEISGRLTAEGKLLIDGKPAEISPGLAFRKVITLSEGTNLIVFQLIRPDSTVKFYRRTVTLRTK